MRFMPTSLPDFPTKLKSLSTSPFSGTASDDDTCNEKLDEEDPPPLGVKVTGYRLLIIAAILGFGIFKAVRVYCGQPLTPTTPEIVGCTILTLMLYGLGLLDGKRPRRWSLFFHTDLAPAIWRFRIPLEVVPRMLIEVTNQVSICFASTLIEVLNIEMKNQKRPEDEKMKQIEIMYFGVTLLMWTIFYVGLYVWLPCILLCVVVLYAKHWFGIYRRQRRSRLLSSPTGNIA